jgi:hypothetical protein
MNFVMMRILVPTPVMMRPLTEMLMGTPQTMPHARPQALCFLSSLTKLFVLARIPQSFFPPFLKRSLFRKIIKNEQVARQKKQKIGKCLFSFN